MKKANIFRLWSWCALLATLLLSNELAVQAQTLTSGTIYKLRNQCSNKVLDVGGASQANSAPLIQWTESSGLNQQFKLESTNSGYYKLTAQHSGKVVDVRASGTANGTIVQQYTSNGTNAQQWQPIDVGNGYYKLVSRVSSTKVLDVSGASTADGAQVQLWTDNGSCAQKWKFELVGSTPPPTTGSTMVSLRQDGTVLVNNQPFFPLGFYGDSVRTPAGVRSMLDAVSSAGLNTIISERNHFSESDYLPLLDHAASKNVYMLEYIHGDTGLITNAIKNKPNHLGWGVYDDADQLASPADLKNVNDRTLALDSTHLTTAPFTTGLFDNSKYNDAQRADWMAATMLPQLEWYPVGKTSNSVRWSYAPYYRLRTLANTKGRTLAAIVQTFGADNSDGWWTWPQAAEVDAMSHAALIAGSKAMFFYTFYDYDQNSTINITRPEIWAKVQRVASEINILKPVLLNGSLTTLAPNYDAAIPSAAQNSTACSIGIWQYEGYKYIAINNTTNQAQNVSISQPGEYDGTAEKMFSYRPSLSFNGTTFTGSLPALETTYYRIKLQQ